MQFYKNHFNKQKIIFFIFLSISLHIYPFFIKALDKTTEKGTTIIGVVTLDKKPLPGATVVIRELQLILKTSKQGTFKLFPIPSGDYTLKVYHPRAVARVIRIRVRKAYFIGIKMQRKIYRESLPMSVRLQYPLDPLSVTRETGNSVSLLPGLLGLSSFYLSTLPSVASPAGYLEKPIFRGQNPAANRFLFGGIETAFPFHGLGIVSAFNKDDMQEIKVFRGVVPVNYRNVGSGLVDYMPMSPIVSDTDIAIRGNPLEIGALYRSIWGAGGLIAFSGKVTPIPFEAETRPYYHYNFQGLAAWEIARGHRLRLSSYGMGDYMNRLGDIVVYRNSDTGHSLQYDFTLSSSKKFSARLEYQKSSLEMYGNYFLASIWNNLVNRDYKQPDGSEIFKEARERILVESTFIMRIKKDHILHIGFLLESLQRSASMTADFHFLDFEQDNIPLNDESKAKMIFFMETKSFNLSGFTRYLAKMGRFGWDAGLRLSRFAESNSFKLEPALMGFFYPTKKDKIYIGSGLYYQQWQPRWSVHLGQDFQPLKPLERFKTELGAKHFFSNSFPVTIVFFGETWKNQPVLAVSDQSRLVTNASFAVFESTGKGKSIGAELIGEYETKKWRSRFSYSYTNAKLAGAEILTNRTHIVNIGVIFKHNDLWTTALQLRIWSTFPGVGSNWPDSIDEQDVYWLKVAPITELGIRFNRKLKFGKPGSRLFIELGQLLSLAYLLAIPPRLEFTSTASLEEAMLGRPFNEKKAIPDLPLILGFGLEVLF